MKLRNPSVWLYITARADSRPRVGAGSEEGQSRGGRALNWQLNYNIIKLETVFIAHRVIIAEKGGLIFLTLSVPWHLRMRTTVWQRPRQWCSFCQMEQSLQKNVLSFLENVTSSSTTD